MPVSRFDNPAEYKPINTFQSEFVEMPFQEINYALASKQKKKDDEFGDVQAKANALNIATIREHEKPREEFVNQYNKKFMDLLDSGIDPTSGEFVRQKKVILDELAKDKRPGVFKRSVDAFKQQQEYTEGLRKQGKYGYYNDPYKKGFQGVDEAGDVNEYQFKPYNPTEDRIEPVINYFKNAKPSGKEREWFNLDESGNIIGVKKGYEGVSSQFIDRNTQSFLTPFLNSNAGRDFVTEYANLGYGPDEIKRAAQDHVRGIGNVFIYGNSSEGINFKYAPQDVREGILQQQIDSQAPVTFDPATPNAHQGDVLNIEFDANGNPSTTYTDASVTGSTVGAGAYVGGSTNVKQIPKTPEQIAKDNAVIKKLQDADYEIYGNQKDYKARTPQELVADHNEAVKNSALYTPTNKNFIGKKGDLITEQKLGGNNTIQNLSGQRLQLLGADGGGQLNFNELEEKVGKTLQTRVQGRALNNPDLPGGMIVSIKGEDGKTTKVTVGADKVTERFFSQYTPVFIDALAGKSSTHKLGDAVIKTHSTPKKKGTYNTDKGESAFITKVVMMTPGGTEQMSLEEFEGRVNDKYEKKYPLLHTAAFETNKEEADIVDDDPQ